MKITIDTDHYDIVAHDESMNVVARRKTYCNPAALHQLICDVSMIPTAVIDWDNSEVAEIVNHESERHEQ